jgi:hypothetical protein
MIALAEKYPAAATAAVFKTLLIDIADLPTAPKAALA